MNLRKIAKALKVSHTTVSRALDPAHAHLISPAVRLKIQAHAKRLGYSPNPTARALALGRSHTVGVVLPTMFNSLFYNEHLIKTLAGIHQILKIRDAYNCRVVFPTQEKSLARLTPKELSQSLDGLLVWSQYVSCEWEHADPAGHEMLADLASWKRPLVVLGTSLQSPTALSSISFDHDQAAYEAVSHLIRNRHRLIALIYRDQDFADSRQRFNGYRRAMKDHQLLISERLIRQSDYTRPGGYRKTLELLQEKSPPTAIFCTNDEMAMGAIQAIQAAGLRCPQDVAVMGFDGLNAGELMTPRLSSAEQPIQEMAAAGMNLLLDLIEKKQKGIIARSIPGRLLIRDSA